MIAGLPLCKAWVGVVPPLLARGANSGSSGATSGVQILLLIVVGFALGANYPTVVPLAHDAWPQRIALASGLVMGLGWVPAGLGASFIGYLADPSSLATAMNAPIGAPVLAMVCVGLYRVWLRPRGHYN